MKKKLIIPILILFSLILVSSASALQCGDTITSSVTLTGDLISMGIGNCLNIGANNVKINCNGFSLIGLNNKYIGIVSQNYDNIEVTGCTVGGFEVTLQFSSSDNGYIHGNTFNDGLHITGTSTLTNITNNTFNLIDDRQITESIAIDSGASGNYFTDNIVNYDSDGEDHAMTLATAYNTISRNSFTGRNHNSFGLTNRDNANNNTITNNSFSNFAEGMIIGAPFTRNADGNTISNNTFINNLLAYEVNGGDLNTIADNYIDSGDGSNTTTDEGDYIGGWGMAFAYSENNIVYNNTVKDQVNFFDVNNNIFCYQGQDNVWDFDLQGCSEGDCIKPNCTNVLDNGGNWFSGGSSLLEINKNRHVKKVVESLTSLNQVKDLYLNPEDKGWRLFHHPDAVDGNLLYNLPGRGDLAGWIIHTKGGQNLDLEVWKFDHQYSSLMTTAARYDIYHANGVDTVYIDQSSSGDEWMPLGRYQFDEYGLQGVAITRTPEGYTLADAVRFTDAG